MPRCSSAGDSPLPLEVSSEEAVEAAATAQSKAVPHPAHWPTLPVCHRAAHATDPGPCAGPKNSSVYFPSHRWVGSRPSRHLCLKAVHSACCKGHVLAVYITHTKLTLNHLS